MSDSLKYNVSVDVIEKLASFICFESFGKAHERRKYFVLLAVPMDTTHKLCAAHAHNLAHYVGKDRQQGCVTTQMRSRPDRDTPVRTPLDGTDGRGWEVRGWVVNG